MTAHTVAAITGLVQSKAITVKFQALGLLAVADHPFPSVVFVGLAAGLFIQVS